MSCSNNEDFFYNENDEVSINNKDSSNHVFNFIFDGIEYSSDYIYASDSSFIFKNKYVENVYNNLLKEYPELSGLVVDSTLYYFRNAVELENFFLKPNNVNIRAVSNKSYKGAKFTFYEDYKYKGYRCSYYTGSYDNLPLPNPNHLGYTNGELSYFGFGVTALDIYVQVYDSPGSPYVAGITLYRTTQMGVKAQMTFSFSSPTLSKGIRGLGDYPYPEGGTWNDKAEGAHLFIKFVN